MRIVLCLMLSLFVAAPVSATAETLVENKVYAGPVALEVPIHNVKVKLPGGFKGALPAGAEAFVMERADGSDGKIFVLIMKSTKAELESTLQGPLPMGQGIVLQPTAKLQNNKGLYTRSYNFPQAEGYNASVTARMVGDRAIGAVVMAPSKSMKSFEKAARSMVKSARKFKPKTPKGAPRGAWAKKLKDKNLYRFYSGSGYSEKTKLTLCADGSFYRNWDMASATQLGTGAGVSNAAGRWTITNNTLSLSHRDGSSSSYALEERDGSLYMNGKKWLRESTKCR